MPFTYILAVILWAQPGRPPTAIQTAPSQEACHMAASEFNVQPLMQTKEAFEQKAEAVCLKIERVFQ